MAKPITKIITNFKGAISAFAHGTLNSGLTPWGLGANGYNPLWNNYKGQVLDVLEAPVDKSNSVVNDTIMHFIRCQNSSKNSGNQFFAYGFDASASVYEIEVSKYLSGWLPDTDSPVKFTNTLGDTAAYGGGLIASAIYSSPYITLYVGADGGVYRASLTAGNQIDIGATWTKLTAISPGAYITNVPRPVCEFLGKLYFGNGNNIAESTDGATFTAGKLNPPFPGNYTVRDMAVSPDGSYMLILITDSQGGYQPFAVNPATQVPSPAPTNSAIVYWNGSDQGYSSIQFFKGINISSIGVSNQEMILVGTDEEGLGIWDLYGNKIAGLPNPSDNSAFIPPQSQSIDSIGNKYFFQAISGSSSYQFCFDRSDNSLYPISLQTFATTPTLGGVLIPTQYLINDSSGTFSEIGRLKMYWGFNKKLYSQHLHTFYANYSADLNAAYQTQFEKLPAKAYVKEVRIFLQPTAANVSFQLAINNFSGSIPNSTFTYAYSSSVGPVDVIKWTPSMKAIREIGLQISNLGTVNPLISRIEIDLVEESNPSRI